MDKKPFESKSIFAWQISNIKNGDAKAIVNLIEDAGFEALYIKVADGAYPFGQNDLNQSLVTELHQRGIYAIGWGFLYGKDWLGEAKIAYQQCDSLGLDGYIFDIESQYENTPNALFNATNIISTFKNGIKNKIPLGFCSWAYWNNPITHFEWHPVKMAQEWMEGCDYGMPMEYWQGSSGAASYLSESLVQWKSFTDKPIIPIGRAYNGDGGTCTPDQILAFEQQARREGCKGISWWGLDWAFNNQSWWNALHLIPKFGSGEISPLPSHVLEIHHADNDTTESVSFNGIFHLDSNIDYVAIDSVHFINPNSSSSTDTIPSEPNGTSNYEQSAPLVKTYTKEFDHSGKDIVSYHVLTYDARDYELIVDSYLSVSFPHTWMIKNNCEYATNGGAGWHTDKVGRNIITSIYGQSISQGKGFGTYDKNWGQIYVDKNGILFLDRQTSIYTTFPYTNLLVKNGEVVSINKAVDYRARTVIGAISEGKNIIVTIDGGDYDKKHGMSFQETAQLMKDLGCVFAVMVDGGGSTSMAYKLGNNVEIIGTPSGEEPVLLNGKNYKVRPTAGHMGLRKK